MNVRPVLITAFRAPNGRRYLTQRSAYKAAARHIIKKHCACEPGSWEDQYPGFVCRYHRPSHYPTLVLRLARHLAYNDTRVGKEPR